MRDRIIDLTLEPGYNIDEKSLLAKFDFGRTPLREALNRLIVEGLIESRGSRGMRVTPMSLSNTRELFDAYILAERMVASILIFSDESLVDDLNSIETIYEAKAGRFDFLEVTEANAAFHNRLAGATRNTLVARYSAQLQNLARRVSFYIFTSEANDAREDAHLFDRPIEEHRQIIAAIEDRDRDHLIGLMTGHAMYFRDRLRKLIGRTECGDVDLVLD